MSATLLDPAFRPHSREEAIRGTGRDPFFTGGYEPFPGARMMRRPDARWRRAQRIAALGLVGYATDEEEGDVEASRPMPGAPAQKSKGLSMGLPLGRVVIDATPDVLDRLDKLTKQAEEANKTARLAVAASVGVAILTLMALATRKPAAGPRLAVVRERKRKKAA